MDKIKQLLETMYNVMDDIGEKTELNEKLEDLGATASAILKMDLIHFLAYLAAADGVISWSESRFIAELFDVHMTPEKLNEYIQDNDIYSERFESEPPMTLQLMVKLDNAVYKSGAGVELEGGSAIMMLFIEAGKALVGSNGETVDTMPKDMRKDFETYMGMMQNYIDAETDKHHVDIITGYEKKKKDSGVKAPKKAAGDNVYDMSLSSVKAPRKRA